jgi:transcriptional regulator with XRE-family HTH domain
MNIQDVIIERIKKVAKDEKIYKFPQFLRELRKSVGISRRALATMLDVSESKIYYMELGKYSRLPEAMFINKLSDFYGVSKSIMMNKLNAFLTTK